MRYGREEGNSNVQKIDCDLKKQINDKALLTEAEIQAVRLQMEQETATQDNKKLQDPLLILNLIIHMRTIQHRIPINNQIQKSRTIWWSRTTWTAGATSNTRTRWGMYRIPRAQEGVMKLLKFQHIPMKDGYRFQRLKNDRSVKTSQDCRCHNKNSLTRGRTQVLV